MEEMNPCRLCERPWHPDTGAIYCEGYLVCGHCEREFWTWVRNRTNAKPSKKHLRVPTARSFYHPTLGMDIHGNPQFTTREPEWVIITARSFTEAMGKLPAQSQEKYKKDRDAQMNVAPWEEDPDDPVASFIEATCSFGCSWILLNEEEWNVFVSDIAQEIAP